MADVQSTATLTVNVRGQESIDALKSQLDSLKSTGEELRSAQFLDPAALRENMNAQIRTTREAEFAARGFGDEAANAQRALESFGRSDAMKQAQQAFVGAQKNLQEVEAAGGDVETAMKGVKDAGEAYNTVVRAERDARREIGRQISEQQAALPTPAEARKGIPGLPTAEELRAGAAPPAAAAEMPGLKDAAAAAAIAIAGLGVAAGVAKGAMEVFSQANVVAAEASRKVIETAAMAQKAGIEYEQAAAERAAGAGLFGEKGMADIQKRFARNLREGGKQLQADLEAIGLKPEEAPPTPVEFARRAAARRAQLQEAITRGDEGAQAAMNAFDSALLRRAGPAMQKVVGELTEQEISDRAAGAQKISDAFTSDIAPKQLRDQSVAFEKSQAEQTQATKGFWDQVGEAATPGLTKYNEAVTQGLVEGGPSAAQAAGKFAGWFAGKTGEYLQGKAAQWQAYQDVASGIMEGVKGAIGLVTPTPAAAAEAVAAAPPPPEPIPIKPDLSEVKSAVEQVPLKPDVSELQAAVQESEIKMPDISALQSAMESLQAIDLSSVAAQISAAGSELGTTAAAGITEAGSSGGQAFGSAAEAGINAAGASGGAAFSSAAQAGITAAGSAGGAAFAAAINPGAIGSAIGSAAAAAISAAKVNVNVNVAGAGGGGASTGKDSAT